MQQSGIKQALKAGSTLLQSCKLLLSCFLRAHTSTRSTPHVSRLMFRTGPPAHVHDTPSKPSCRHMMSLTMDMIECCQDWKNLLAVYICALHQDFCRVKSIHTNTSLHSPQTIPPSPPAPLLHMCPQPANVAGLLINTRPPLSCSLSAIFPSNASLNCEMILKGLRKAYLPYGN